MKTAHPYLNWPTAVFALGTALLLPLKFRYSILGPSGLDHVPTLFLGGVWFLFGSFFTFAATRSARLEWMLRLSRKGSHMGEKRVAFVILGSILFVVGSIQLVRAALFL